MERRRIPGDLGRKRESDPLLENHAHWPWCRQLNERLGIWYQRPHALSCRSAGISCTRTLRLADQSLLEQDRTQILRIVQILSKLTTPMTITSHDYGENANR